ncbi:MAG: diheme cytochrome c [Azonexus sp.]|jgi:hypothetical protein|nr:diheme cytochrome c [Betaproteobacteria bacterium]MBK8918110.1 diheme cytochrome c [Betaproteobacteria bacterium]MBP6035327.1 diheme cytochrome c [Azonexus sp.]MBP6906098.1 diheme cytochrome c [Azonexus sp.]
MKATFFHLCALLPMFAAPVASGDERRSLPLSKEYREECGSCHVPYPPQMLSARSWRLLMSGLDKHFGSDASLESGKSAQIAAYLAANAGQPDTRETPASSPRITQSAWFLREHRDGHDGLSAAVWRSPAVKSPANCGACHRGAADGSYREGEIRLPRQS